VSTLSQRKIRKIIKEELELHYHATLARKIQEGVFDDVKDGLKKLSAFVSKQFSKAAASWAKVISEKLSSMKIPEETKQMFQVIKQAMKETGESFKLNDSLKAAQELQKLGEAGAMNAIEQDLAGPVKEKAKQAQAKTQSESYIGSIYKVLSETPETQKSNLNEDFGASAVVGIGLAVMGGLPMLFKGLHKLANVLNAPNAAAMFEKAEHVTHAFEQKTIDFIVPDKLSYAVYKILFNKGIKMSNEMLSFEEFQVNSDKSNAMKKAQGLIYKSLLIYFAVQGIHGVLKAGTSLLAFVEGAATGVKGVELAKGAAEVAQLVKASSSAATAV
jgi:hypothetical protein